MTKQKKKLVRQDLERYEMGQVRFKDIVSNRGVTEYQVRRMSNEILHTKLYGNNPTPVQ